MQHLTLFSTVIQQRGAYIRGGLITGCIFLFPVDGPITGGGLTSGGGGGGGGGGGAYNRNFTGISSLFP